MRSLWCLVSALMSLWSMTGWAECYNSNWQYRMPMTLDLAQTAAAQSDVLILIKTISDEAFVPDNLSSNVTNPDGEDIVFMAAVLSHEVEFGDDGSSECVASVQVDTPDAGAVCTRSAFGGA